jgi:hypothetical protein
MTLQLHQRLTLAGFILVYLSMMVWMILVTAVHFDGIRGAIQWGLLVPAGILGMSLIVSAKLRYAPNPSARSEDYSA